MSGAHSLLQGLEGMISYWSPSESIILNESSVRHHKSSIIFNKLTIIAH
jgi:hypothetical protein